MLSGVVLASGLSRRMGRDKLSLAFHEHTILWHSVAALLVPGLGELCVVLPPNANHRLPPDSRIRRVTNRQCEEGIAASLRAGVSAIDRRALALVVTLGDKPLLNPTTVSSAIARWSTTRPDVLVTRYRAQSGHPVIFRDSVFDQLSELTGDRGAQQLLQKGDTTQVILDTEDPGVVFDIDTDDDYTRLVREH